MTVSERRLIEAVEDIRRHLRQLRRIQVDGTDRVMLDAHCEVIWRALDSLVTDGQVAEYHRRKKSAETERRETA